MNHIQNTMANAGGAGAAESSTSSGFFTPLNVLLFGVTLYTVYTLLRPPLPSPPTAAPAAGGTKSAASLPPRDPPAQVYRSFTPRTLRPYDGADGKPILVAVRGRVFDVSPSRGFYGPGGPYANFAGRDASRGLACYDFDEAMLNDDLDGPLDDLTQLEKSQLELLDDWELRFRDKYLEVGRLVAAADFKGEDIPPAED